MRELHGLLAEERLQPSRQARVIVAEIEGAEAGQRVEVAAARVVPEPHVERAGEHAAVAEQAQQLHEGRVDVARVRAHRALRLGQHVRATGNPSTRSPRSIA